MKKGFFRHKRSRLDSATWSMLLEVQEGGDLIVKDFCISQDIGVASFYQWRSRLQGGTVAAGAPEALFVPTSSGNFVTCKTVIYKQFRCQTIRNWNRKWQPAAIDIGMRWRKVKPVVPPFDFYIVYARQMYAHRTVRGKLRVHHLHTARWVARTVGTAPARIHHGRVVSLSRLRPYLLVFGGAFRFLSHRWVNIYLRWFLPSMSMAPTPPRLAGGWQLCSVGWFRTTILMVMQF